MLALVCAVMIGLCPCCDAAGCPPCCCNAGCECGVHCACTKTDKCSPACGCGTVKEQAKLNETVSRACRCSEGCKCGRECKCSFKGKCSAGCTCFKQEVPPIELNLSLPGLSQLAAGLADAKEKTVAGLAEAKQAAIETGEKLERLTIYSAILGGVNALAVLVNALCACRRQNRA